MGNAKPTLTMPSVHLNGTSYSGLLNPMERAVEAVGKAVEAVAECAPHGRDYYLQGDEAFAKARSEHLSRISRLQGVLEEVKLCARHVRRSAPGRAPQ